MHGVEVHQGLYFFINTEENKNLPYQLLHMIGDFDSSWWIFMDGNLKLHVPGGKQNMCKYRFCPYFLTKKSYFAYIF